MIRPLNFDEGRAAAGLPPHAQALIGREKEVAAIVYARGACTARDVQARLSTNLSNAAVRSMLMRLVEKGVLGLERGHRGPGQPSTYFPTVVADDVKNRAVQQLCDRYFDGSLLNLVMAALEVLQRRQLARNDVNQQRFQGVASSFEPERRAHS